MDKINLLILAPDYPPGLGGVERFVSALVSVLPKQKYKIKILAGTRTQRQIKRPVFENHDDYEIVRIPTFNPGGMDLPTSLTYYKIVWRLLKWASIIHLNDVRVFFTLSIMSALLYKKRIILTPMGFIFHTNKYKLLKKIYSKYFSYLIKKFVYKVIAIGYFDYQFSLDNKFPVVYIPVGCDLASYYSIERLPEENYFLCYGRLAENKNLEKLFFQLAEFKKNNTSFILNLVGAGDDKYTKKLKNLVFEKELEKNVIFHGKVSDKTLLKFLEKAELVFFPSLFESFGFTIIESLASGCVLIANKNQQFEFMLQDVSGAHLVDFDNKEDFFKAINRAKSEKINDNLKGRNFTKSYLIEEIAEKYDKLYST